MNKIYYFIYCQRKKCEHFINCLKNNRQPLTDGEDGVDVLRVLLAIDSSIAAQGAYVKVG